MSEHQQRPEAAPAKSEGGSGKSEGGGKREEGEHGGSAYGSKKSFYPSVALL